MKHKLLNSDVDNSTDDLFSGVHIQESPSHMTDAALELDSDVESDQEWTEDDLNSRDEYETGDSMSAACYHVNIIMTLLAQNNASPVVLLILLPTKSSVKHC